MSVIYSININIMSNVMYQYNIEEMTIINVSYRNNIIFNINNGCLILLSACNNNSNLMQYLMTNIINDSNRRK